MLGVGDVIMATPFLLSLYSVQIKLGLVIGSENRL